MKMERQFQVGEGQGGAGGESVRGDAVRCNVQVRSAWSSGHWICRLVSWLGGWFVGWLGESLGNRFGRRGGVDAAKSRSGIRSNGAGLLTRCISFDLIASLVGWSVGRLLDRMFWCASSFVSRDGPLSWAWCVQISHGRKDKPLAQLPWLPSPSPSSTFLLRQVPREKRACGAGRAFGTSTPSPADTTPSPAGLVPPSPLPLCPSLHFSHFLSSLRAGCPISLIAPLAMNLS